VVPALAIAAALQAKGADVEFVGADRAEAELVPAAGYRLHRLAVRAIDRHNPLLAARAGALALIATAAARALLLRVGADAVIGAGGYVAGPVGLAAATARIPLAICEADSQLGLANRLLAPFARRAFLAFPIAGREGGKYSVTGRPVPAGTGAADRRAARRRFGIEPHERCLLVFGGSLGARSLNHASVEAFGERGPCAVLHIAGRRDFGALRARLEALGAPAHYHLCEYVEPFADALAVADLAAARAGGSVFELAAAGVPAILVPYPHASADHQSSNARWMAEAGAALIVRDSELSAARLAGEVEALLAAPQRLQAMAAAALRVARPDAAERIAAETLELIR